MLSWRAREGDRGGGRGTAGAGGTTELAREPAHQGPLRAAGAGHPDPSGRLDKEQGDTPRGRPRATSPVHPGVRIPGRSRTGRHSRAADFGVSAQICCASAKCIASSHWGSEQATGEHVNNVTAPGIGASVARPAGAGRARCCWPRVMADSFRPRCAPAIVATMPEIAQPNGTTLSRPCSPAAGAGTSPRRAWAPAGAAARLAAGRTVLRARPAARAGRAG